jgi:serine/threonine-protein kinase
MSVEASDLPDLSGTQYTIEKLLGKGGFGQAFQVFNRGLRRRCVLKLLMDVSNPNFVARFHREAQVMANLDHPAIPRVYEVNTTKDGRPYFVMEFIDGASLGEYLVERGGRLPIDEACRLTAEAAEGLAAAHEMGVVHRDVKLANILVSRKGQAKVIDFGIARKAVQEVEQTPGVVTMLGQLLGTPRYMSPEQAMAKPLGPSSDFYSLGVVLFILLTGRSPFEGTGHEMMVAHVTEPAPPLGGRFPPALEALVAKLLSKSPEARYSNGNELARALRAIGSEGQAVAAPHPDPIRDAPTAIPATSVTPPPAFDGVDRERTSAPAAVARLPARTDLRIGIPAYVDEPSMTLSAVGAERFVSQTQVAVRADLRPSHAPPEPPLPAPVLPSPVVPTPSLSSSSASEPVRAASPPRVEHTPSSVQSVVGVEPRAPRINPAYVFAFAAFGVTLGAGSLVLLLRSSNVPTVQNTPTTPAPRASEPPVSAGSPTEPKAPMGASAPFANSASATASPPPSVKPSSAPAPSTPKGGAVSKPATSNVVPPATKPTQSAKPKGGVIDDERL